MAAMAEVVERTLAGMGFELVDARASGGWRFLTIFIDRPGGITVDHCAEVSRQLSRVFEVEGIDFDRLEVSSPGLDRPLRKPADFERFAGSRVDVKMRMKDVDGRKRFTGLLVPFFRKGLAATRLGFERMNLALKNRAEGRTAS